jgi:hypothetical protein
MRVKLSPLDITFSEFIRKRAIHEAGGCEFCRKQLYDKTKENGDILPAWKQLECSHFYGRRMKSVRYDPDNAAGVCFTCHRMLTENPFVHTEFFMRRLGEKRFERLYLQANTLVKLSNFDKQIIQSDLRDRITREDWRKEE